MEHFEGVAMHKKARKSLVLIIFLILTISFISCKDNGLAGRTYSGTFDGATATISFDKDGDAFFEIENEESAQLEYSAKKGAYAGNCVLYPAMVFEGKYDDDSLLLIWWGGHPIVLERTDSEKRPESSKNSKKNKNSIEGRTYMGLFDGSYMDITFEKFGLALVTINDETTDYFYTENTNARKVHLKEEYVSTDDEDLITFDFSYDDEALWGTNYEEEIRLVNLDSILAPKAYDYDKDEDNLSGKTVQTSNKSVRELTPPETRHTETYETLIKYGFSTSEGTIQSDYISVSTSQYRALSGIHAVFINDDGKNCFLDRKFLTSPEYVERNTLTTPKHLDITDCIKEVLYATEGGVLRYAFVLIECKESDTSNILLQNIYGRNLLGDFVQSKIFSEVDKDESLENLSADIMTSVKNSNDYYYSNSLKWFIEKM